MVKSPEIERFLCPRFARVRCAITWEKRDARGFGVFMPRTRRWVLLALAILLLASVSLAQTKPHHPRHSKKPAPKPLVLPPLPSGPLPQLPMDQMPASPPKVGFQGGLLTIVAQNSTLGDILREVRKLTGATIDIPGNASERVVTRLGPGAPRDVLASLLNGSSFNYVMLGSNSDPSAVTSVVLTAKPAGAQSQTAATVSQPNQGYVASPMPPRPFVAQGVPQPAAVQPAGDDNANADDQDASTDDNADQEGQTDASGTAQPDQQQQPGLPANTGPRTPEQILDMIRRQQQQPPTAIPPAPQQPPEN